MAMRVTATSRAFVLAMIGLISLPVTVSAGYYDEAPASAPEPQGRVAVNSELRLAYSEHGLEFRETEAVFARHAASPSLVVLPKGTILAVFDFAAPEKDGWAVSLAVARSRDDGKSWSAMRPVEFVGGTEVMRSGRRGRLVHMKDGSLRLYITYDPKGKAADQRGSRSAVAAVTSAVTKDGILYRVDTHPPVLVGGDAGKVHPLIQRVGNLVHLFDQRSRGDAHEEARLPSRVWHHVSSDGRRFSKVEPIDLTDVRFEGSIVQTAAGMRAYVSDGAGIVSLTSLDSQTWYQEPGLRVRGGWDPSVVRLASGGYLMIYCMPIEEQTADRGQQLVDPSFILNEGRLASAGQAQPEGAGPGDGSHEGHHSGVEGPVPEDWAVEIEAELATALAQGEQLPDEESFYEEMLEPVDAETSAAGADEGSTLSDEAGGLTPGSDAGDSPDEAVASSALDDSDSGIQEELEDADVVEVSEGPTDQADEELYIIYDPYNWSPERADDFAGMFAPLPDFEDRVNYFEWFKTHMLRDPDDNAFYSYAEFLPSYYNDPDPKELPEMTGPLTGGDYDGPLGPWDPEEHPDWAASNDNIQDLLAQYREATEHADYESPPMLADDEDWYAGEDPLLLGLLLPSLSSHRTMVKATIEDAWRLRDGEVSGERMIEALRTTFRNADHLNDGYTLIEHLVGTAERGLAQKHARKALQYDVFSDEELEAALDVLIEYDRDDRDPARWIAGEHAMSMQLIQAMFPPPPPGERHKIDEDVVQLVNAMSENAIPVEELRGMDIDNARRSAEAFDSYYRDLGAMLRVGYPEYRGSDFYAKEAEVVGSTPLTNVLMPSFSRVHQLKTRAESSARATRLAYAVELFKRQNGRYPDSFDELPAEYAEGARTDPFTGRDFGYRLTDDGPQIYSYSENGLDDGGVHSARWGDNNEREDESDDFVFWPPQQR
jgi:hypothetical protein